jgi:predicted N-acetyltransferase YhbS
MMKYLIDSLDSVETIAKWHMAQWGHIMPGLTFEKYSQELATRYAKLSIPTMMVDIRDDHVVGTVALEDFDMDSHREFTPWLASLYVDKDYRRYGIGRALVLRAIEEAKACGVKRLYLFTPDQAHFFAHFGWRLLFKEDYYGEDESVMVLEISM